MLLTLNTQVTLSMQVTLSTRFSPPHHSRPVPFQPR